MKNAFPPLTPASTKLSSSGARTHTRDGRSFLLLRLPRVGVNLPSERASERDAVRKATPSLASRHDGAGLEAGRPSAAATYLFAREWGRLLRRRRPSAVRGPLSSSVHLHKKPFRNSGRSIVSVRRGGEAEGGGPSGAA